jgi:hypothetical protein
MKGQWIYLETTDVTLLVLDQTMLLERKLLPKE